MSAAAANTGHKTVVMITSPLEAEHAERVAAVAPDRVELIYRPDLMPPTRYQGDHNGPGDWKRTPEADAEFRRLLARAEVLWDFSLLDGANPFDLSPNLKWVQTSSAGVGQMVKRIGVAESDLIVTTSSGVHAKPLTEFVFAVLLYHEKWFAQIGMWKADKHWQRYCTGEIDGKTIAIIGPGRIGREIGRIAHAFGMRVHVMARTFDPARAADLNADRLFARDELHELLASADYLVLCAPHTPDTENMLGAAEIAVMKPGVVLVNIARGVVIDEDAMIEALKSGQIALAGLDVFRTEPLPVSSPLWDLPNVIVNPHSASTAPSENRKIAEIFCRNLEHYLAGRYDQMSPILDKQRLY